MTYTPTTWADGVTPVNAANMNKIEAALAAAGGGGGSSIACIADTDVLEGQFLYLTGAVGAGGKPLVIVEGWGRQGIGVATHDALTGAAVDVQFGGEMTGLVGDGYTVKPGDAIAAAGSGFLRPMGLDEDTTYAFGTAIDPKGNNSQARLAYQLYRFYAYDAGAAGNDCTVEVRAVASQASLSVTTTNAGKTVLIRPVCDSSGNILSTYEQVISQLGFSGSSKVGLDSINTADRNLIAPAMGVTSLTGGSDPASDPSFRFAVPNLVKEVPYIAPLPGERLFKRVEILPGYATVNCGDLIYRTLGAVIVVTHLRIWANAMDANTNAPVLTFGHYNALGDPTVILNPCWTIPTSFWTTAGQRVAIANEVLPQVPYAASLAKGLTFGYKMSVAPNVNPYPVVYCEAEYTVMSLDAP